MKGTCRNAIRLALLLFLLGASTLIGHAQQAPPHPLQPDHLGSGIVAAEQQAAAKLSAIAATPQTNDYDLKYHRLEWIADPAINYIQGAVTSYFVPVVGALDTLFFDLSDSLTVDSVKYRGQSVAHAHAGDLLRIFLPNTLPMGVLDSVSVWYQGEPVGTGFGSFIQSNHNSTPVLWTLSEPYGARDWWPCKNGIIDKIDSIDVMVTTPNGNKVASNGVLVSLTPGSGVNTYHWRHRHPIATYLIAFATTNYVSYSNWVPYNGDTLEVLNYVFPEDSASFAYYTPNIIATIQLYDTLFGTYPYQDEKYGHAEFGWGGGMEHQTMSFVVNASYELIAHELAHQWFGDKITCNSWRDIWLNEGWATYCSGLCYEHGLGTLPWMDFKQQRRDHVTSVPDGSVYVTDTTSVGRIFDGRLSYSKGAMILHQLRWVIGDSAFFAATYNYMNASPYVYDFATTDNFRAQMEASSGRNLGWYFDDWYYGEGYPTYMMAWGQTADTVTIELSQTTSMPSSVPFFALPVPVRFTNGSQDTTVILDHTFSGQIFRVHLPFTATGVDIDPDIWLIRSANFPISSLDATPAQSVEVYPNPAQGFVNLRGRQFERVDIMDLAGHCLAAQALDRTAATQRVDLPQLPAGAYLLRIHAGGRVDTQRLMIAR